MNGIVPELYWTVYTAALTAILWMPHVVQRFLEMGVMSALSDPKHDMPTKAAWAQRSIRAHTNAIENLAVLIPIAVVFQLSGKSSPPTAQAAEIFFFARLAHYFMYVFAVPYLRTVSFLIGFGCLVRMFIALVS